MPVHLLSRGARWVNSTLLFLCRLCSEFQASEKSCQKPRQMVLKGDNSRLSSVIHMHIHTCISSSTFIYVHTFEHTHTHMKCMK